MEQEHRNTKKPSSLEDGSSLTCTKTGGLHIGCFESTPQEALVDVDAILSQAGIAHVAEEDIRYRMWAKLMLNVGINQTCCAFGASYGDVYADETSELWRTFISATRGVVALSQAEGVALTEEALSAYAAPERTLDPASTPSRGQDRTNCHRTEVDEFSGEVMRRAEKHHILVPVNASLNKRIREIGGPASRHSMGAVCSDGIDSIGIESKLMCSAASRISVRFSKKKLPSEEGGLAFQWLEQRDSNPHYRHQKPGS